MTSGITKRMKTKRLLLSLVASLLPLPLFAADDVPRPFEFARYQAMLDRSPFAVATAAAPAPAPTPNFAKDLYVANAARSKDGDLVTIASSADKNFKKYLKSNQPQDGYSIASIEWSEKVGGTKVTISKDGQTATLTFNEALLRVPLAAGQNVPPQQQQQQLSPLQAQPPGVQPPAPTGQPPNVQKPMPVPSLPTPPPRVRGVIPRNPVPTTPVPAPTPAEVEL